MTIYYLTKEGEMLDLICWKHYGFTDGVVELALAENLGLAEYGSFLPAGLKIKLSAIQKTVQKSKLKVWE
ncbi:MAG: tail protein X [Wolbachia endosymbiont of Nomada fabriciana]|uniref:tail protein X n=1 Tax=unclassified Wolbachia TaxID=2640676 RepID=UPI0007EEBD26|nr:MULTISPECIES: tail protein X [unclassified Wolbachia]MDX5496644.1 tail protein X [Wolbachia endosymbiont of Nomada fabriciana]MDX5518640.1 tail protein X [Wolbachia endosymbiont of Andrena agilissima]MDX5528021.1 tail protein X [Wolbachia endosymbiont of Andrena minutula]